jgi:integration host factor subunit beta
MIRSQLVAQIAEEFPNLTADEADRVVRHIFEEITRSLEAGDRVELRGFGSFSTRLRDPRQGLNPRTGDSVAVPAKHMIHFRAGTPMLARLNAPAD